MIVDFDPPNPRELLTLRTDIAAVWQHVRDAFPDTDPTPERRVQIEALVNVLRAASAYAGDRAL